MKLKREDPRLKQALSEWAGIAPSLGMDVDSFTAKVIWQKNEPARNHIVVRLKGPSRNLVLKRVFTAPEDARLPDAINAQRHAFERLASHPFAHAPEVLFSSDDGMIVVMEDVPGKTLNDHLDAGRPHRQMLSRAGRWLAAFHRSDATEQRTYQPRFMVAHVDRMRDGVATGRIKIAEVDLFLNCCSQIHQIAKYAADQSTVSAVKHGDFNLRNILMGPGGETGLDFKPITTAPVAFDVSRILMDYAELFQPTLLPPSGALLSDDTLSAFFEGYDIVGRDDPAVRFVPFVQLLNDWRLIPVDPSQRSWRQAARMKTIKMLARYAFKAN